MASDHQAQRRERVGQDVLGYRRALFKSLIAWPAHAAFFRRRPETADPRVLEEEFG